MGHYREGFKDYEWRWRRDLRVRTYPYQFHQTRWQGKPFPDQRLLVYSEQGLGDTIQFSPFFAPGQGSRGRGHIRSPARARPTIKKSHWQKQLDPDKINIGLTWARRDKSAAT